MSAKRRTLKKKPWKKLYAKPRLIIYGDLWHLTKVKGGKSWDFGAPRTRLSWWG